MNDIEAIKKLYVDYWTYMISKNAYALRTLMADEYQLTHMTGVKQSAKEFLNGLIDGTFNYYSADHDCIQVSIEGNSAKMTGNSRVTAAVYGGNKSAWRLCGHFALRKENDRWKLISSKVTTY